MCYGFLPPIFADQETEVAVPASPVGPSVSAGVGQGLRPMPISTAADTLRHAPFSQVTGFGCPLVISACNQSLRNSHPGSSGHIRSSPESTRSPIGCNSLPPSRTTLCCTSNNSSLTLPFRWYTPPDLGFQYLVDRDGYSPEERSWILSRFILDPSLLTHFHRCCPDHPGPSGAIPREGVLSGE